MGLIPLCSAGVGRTGCYIVLDAMMRQIASRGDVNVFSYLKHIRRQRNHLVQTEEQYVFLHDALAEAVEGGETHIGKGCLPRYIHSLQCVDLTDEKSHSNKLLEKQYRVSKIVATLIDRRDPIKENAGLGASERLFRVFRGENGQKYPVTATCPLHSLLSFFLPVRVNIIISLRALKKLLKEEGR